MIKLVYIYIYIINNSTKAELIYMILNYVNSTFKAFCSLKLEFCSKIFVQIPEKLRKLLNIAA